MSHLVTALFHEMTVEALSDLDLSYTPPLESPWNLGQMGAQDWSRAIRTTPLGSHAAELLQPSLLTPKREANAEKEEGGTPICGYD